MFESAPEIYSNKFLKSLVKGVNSQIKDLFGGHVHKLLLPLVETIFWLAVLFLIDFLLQKIIGKALELISRSSKFPWIRKFYEFKVFRSLIHFIPVSILLNLNPYVFQKYHGFDRFADKLISLFVIFLVVRLVFRIIDAIIAINDNNTSHATVGVRTFGQMIKIFAAFFGVIYFIATLIDSDPRSILTVLGALTAVVLLIFRDSILGFVSGLQIASSKSIKVGDWVSVSKYNIEGIVKEINLAITKVENFDKTVSTIPTYDLIASEVTNHSVMVQSNTKRIKRSIYFNVNSFQFCNQEMLDRFYKIDLLVPYLNSKLEEIQKSNEKVINKDYIINGRQLTNVGVFRVYAENYLKSRNDISKFDKIIVHQLEQTAQGIPVEIVCFTNSADMLKFDRIQSDIFDHLISASKEFDLIISQPIIIQNND